MTVTTAAHFLKVKIISKRSAKSRLRRGLKHVCSHRKIFDLTWLFCISYPLHSMFSQQQASPQFTQQNNGNMYNGNGMSLNNVSMASNMATSSMSSMGQMAGQMSVTSMASGPSPGLPSMGQEQVNDNKDSFLTCWSSMTQTVAVFPVSSNILYSVHLH